METETTPGAKLETASDTVELFSGYEAAGGRKDAVYHVGQYFFTQDEEAFNDVYAQLTDPEYNDPVYVSNFKRTVDNLTSLIAFGKIEA